MKKKRKQKKKAFFIAIEGISASGKSEIIHNLQNQLEQKDIPVVIIKWNSNRVIRFLIRCFSARGSLSPQIYSCLQWINFLYDYFMQYKKFLRQDCVVIADRYFLTILNRNLTNGLKNRLSLLIGRLICKPDIIAFINTPPRECYSRIKKRGKPFFLLNKKIKHSSGNRMLKYLRYMRINYHLLFANPAVASASKIIISNGNSFDLLRKIYTCFPRIYRERISCGASAETSGSGQPAPPLRQVQ